MACPVLKYMEAVREKLGENITGALFKSTYGNTTFTKTPMGKNMLGTIGKQIAQALDLPNWEKYTGHTFRYELSFCTIDFQK